MKRVCILLILGSIGYANEQTFARDVFLKFDCTVKHQSVVTNPEGNPKVYSGVEGQHQEGEIVPFEIFTSLTIRPDQVYPETPLLASFGVAFVPEVFTEFPLQKIETYQEDTLIINASDIDGSYLSISEDRITVRGRWGNPQIELNRYYKSDWSGLISQTFYLPVIGESMFARITSLDCDTDTDRLSILKTFVPKKDSEK